MAEDVYDQGKLLFQHIRNSLFGHAIILPGLASRAAGIPGHV